jgi:hypothetical protein
MPMRRREKGALLGVVMVLVAVLLGASVFAYFGLRSDSGATAGDRLTRQLLDCAEQGLAVGKQYFTAVDGPGKWSAYYYANTVCASGSNLLPACQSYGGPIPVPTNGGAAPPYATYPNQAPFTNTIQVPLANGNSLPLTYTFGIYNAPSAPSTKNGTPAQPEGPFPGPANTSSTATENDNQAIIYARCTEPGGRSRAVQALINFQPPNSNDYLSVDGHGMRNQGNFNSPN